MMIMEKQMIEETLHYVVKSAEAITIAARVFGYDSKEVELVVKSLLNHLDDYKEEIMCSQCSCKPFQSSKIYDV
jgi:hypothetical protein